MAFDGSSTYIKMPNNIMAGLTSITWQQARLKEYHNYGAGAGVNANRPQLTDVEAYQ